MFTFVYIFRKHLDQQRQEFEMMKTKHEMHLNAEKSEIATMKVHLSQLKHDIDVEKEQVQREKHELELQLHMVQPNLFAIQQEKSEIAQLKQNSERLLISLTDQANSMNAIEKELMERELHCQKYWSEISNMEEQCITKEQNLVHKEKVFQVAKKKLDKDRFLLHQCMMEMHSQVDVIKNGIKQAMKYKMYPIHGNNQGIENLNTAESNEAIGSISNRNSFGISNDNDTSITHIVFALEQAGQALTQLMHQHDPHVIQTTEESNMDSIDSVNYTMQAKKSLIRTNQHLESINSQLIELNSIKTSQYDNHSHQHRLLQSYNQLDAQANSGNMGDSPLGIESVLSDISNQAAMLNTISLKYSYC